MSIFGENSDIELPPQGKPAMSPEHIDIHELTGTLAQVVLYLEDAIRVLDREPDTNIELRERIQAARHEAIQGLR